MKRFHDQINASDEVGDEIKQNSPNKKIKIEKENSIDDHISD